MSTPTEAHRKLWNQLRALGTQSREVHGQALQLLADSEARAVERAMSMKPEVIAYPALLEIAKELRERVRVLEEALRKTADLAEHLAQSKDYLGTGDDHRAADKEQREDLAAIAGFRAALATPERKEGEQ